MDRFCKEGSEGCSQEDILLETRDMEGLGLQLDLPAGFCPMDEERQEKLYPWEGRPPLLWENGAVQLTGQLTEQKLDPGETWQAAWALWELTGELFPEQAVSPVYLDGRGGLPVGWFQMAMAQRGEEHIKAVCAARGRMVLVTFTYPAEAALQWRSIIRHSFGTWREQDGADQRG